MKKSPILSILCALLLVSFVSGCGILFSGPKYKKTKGKIVSRVKSLDRIPPDAKEDDGSGWKLIDWGEGEVQSYTPKGARIFVVVYFFREFKNFTCRTYQGDGGKAASKAISLPKKSLGVGHHKFITRSRLGSVVLKCQESDSMPLTLSEFEAGKL